VGKYRLPVLIAGCLLVGVGIFNLVLNLLSLPPIRLTLPYLIAGALALAVSLVRRPQPKRAVAVMLALLVTLSSAPLLAHDLPTSDPSEYIRPREPEVVDLARDVGKGPRLLDNMRAAYYWVSWNVKYVFDRDRWGVDDYWQLPSTTIALRTGDCEDQAFLLASLLRALGVPRENVHVVLGRVEWLSGGLVGYHAWVEVKIPRETAQAFREVALQALESLENKTLVLFLEERPLYVKVTKESIIRVEALGWGDRDEWVPLDPTVAVLALPEGGAYRKVPIPFSLWLWLGYYVYYLGGVKAVPEVSYEDKPWTYDDVVRTPPGGAYSLDIPCVRGEAVSGYIKGLVTALAAGAANTTVKVALSGYRVVGEVADPGGNVVARFELTGENPVAPFTFTAAKEGVYRLTVRNYASYDIPLRIYLSGDKSPVAPIVPIELAGADESTISAELEYIRTEIAPVGVAGGGEAPYPSAISSSPGGGESKSTSNATSQEGVSGGAQGGGGYTWPQTPSEAGPWQPPTTPPPSQGLQPSFPLLSAAIIAALVLAASAVALAIYLTARRRSTRTTSSTPGQRLQPSH